MLYTTHLLRHLRQTIGKNIHDTRIKKGVSLEKLTHLTNVPVFRLDHYEMGKGNPKVEDLLRISCALGVEVGALMR